MSLKLGCIADDYTGASDLANTLTRAGLRTVQTIGVPADDLRLPDVDAVRAADLRLDCLRAAAGSPAIPAEAYRREVPQSTQPQRATGIVGSALRATNGAFAQAGARVVPLAPDPHLKDIRDLQSPESRDPSSCFADPLKDLPHRFRRFVAVNPGQRDGTVENETHIWCGF